MQERSEYRQEREQRRPGRHVGHWQHEVTGLSKVRRMRELRVLLPLVGVALLSGCWARPGHFSKAPNWERIWVKDPGARGYAGQFSGMDFTDARRGWVGHSAHPLMRTSDGGATWTTQYAPSAQVFLGCFDFLNERIGWAVESGWPSRMVGVTTDGGASWQRSPLKAEQDLQELAAVSAREAWAIGPMFPRNRLYHTIDGGVTWSQVSYPVSRQGVNLEAIRFVDRTHGWIVAAERVEGDRPWDAEARPVFILRTTDGGKSFSVSTMAPGGSADECGLEFRNRLEGWVTLGSASLLHTTDGGRTWDRVTPPASVLGGDEGTPRKNRPKELQMQVHLRDCSFPTPNSGWVVGNTLRLDGAWREEAVVLHTADGGKSWRREPVGTETLWSSRLDRVVFADEKHGWAYGAGGDPGDDMTGRQSHWMTFILTYVP